MASAIRQAEPPAANEGIRDLRIGLFAIGLDAYWSQFEGLEQRLTDEWSAQGPAHHCAVGVGHIAGKIEKLGALLGIETVRIR